MSSVRRPTLADVAAAAGVSVTTASYVLNGRAQSMRISSDAEDRVRRAAEELRYRPNRNARSLRTLTTATIGVISDNVASGHHGGQMLAGAAAAAQARDHVLVIGESAGDPQLEARLIEEMIDRQVDGLLYATLSAKQIKLPAALSGIPVVLLNCIDAEERTTSVIPDEVAGGALAARTLLGAGVEGEIHVVGEDPNLNAIAGPRRLRGLQEGLAAAGRTVTGVVPCAWDVRPAYDAVGAWLARGGRADALVCLNDRIAMGAYQALAEAGLRVPQDVSVVSFDGSDLGTWLRPELTSVAIPFSELGARAADLLFGPEIGAGTVVEVAMPLMPGASVRSRVSSPHGATRTRG